MNFRLKKIKINFLFLLGLFLIASCSTVEEDLVTQRAPNFETPMVTPPLGTAGSADFSNYIAIGNSLTAGFADGALYTDGQENSYPNFIAQQLQLIGVGGENFSQPNINSVLGFSGILDGVILGRFFLDVTGSSVPTPTFTIGGDLIEPYTGDKTTLNNFGVPGATVGQLILPGFGSSVGNPYYARFATSEGATLLGDALATNPTFFTLWIGANDILGFALGGGAADGDPITDMTSFTADYANILGQLAATGAKGVVVTVPPVTTIPYLQAIPYNPIPIDQATADLLNGAAAFGAFNAVLDGLVLAGLLSQADADARKISFMANPQHSVLIIDETLTDLGPFFDGALAAGLITAADRAFLAFYEQVRFSAPGDLIPLPTVAILGTPVNNDPALLQGISVPLEDKDILTVTEVIEVVTARATFNGIIAGAVQQVNTSSGANNIALLDIQPLFADALGLSSASATQLVLSSAAIERADGQIGLLVNSNGKTGPEALTGVVLQPDFSPNGIFSVDGIHPNPRGYAIVSNEIIKTINANFAASIPLVDILAKRSIYFQ